MHAQTTIYFLFQPKFLMLKALVLSQRRSGSTFGVKTVKEALGLDSSSEQYSLMVRPYSQCDELLDANRITLRWKMWRTKTAIIKIEEPYSHSNLIDHLTATFPKIKAIATIRNIEAIVNSRMALRQAWAKSSSPQKVLDEWIAHYHFLETYLKDHPGQLFFIDIDQPENFDAAAFCRFLNTALTDDFREYANSFKPINTREIQAKRHKLDLQSQESSEYTKADLIAICPQLEKYEELYRQMLESQLNTEVILSR